VLSEVELILFELTDFQINLQLQNKLERLWQNSIEFNNSDFEELYQESNFDLLILVELSPQAEALEITLRVLNLSNDQFGRVAFTGGRASVPLDWNSVNVATINLEEIQNIRSDLEALSRSINIITNPSNFVEHLHNARIHLANQDLSLAIQSYQDAIILNEKYADVIDEFFQTLVVRFGVQGAQLYLDRQLYPNVSQNVQLYLNLAYQQYTLSELKDILENVAPSYPPLFKQKF
jgi:hypothetical protein